MWGGRREAGSLVFLDAQILEKAKKPTSPQPQVSVDSPRPEDRSDFLSILSRRARAVNSDD